MTIFSSAAQSYLDALKPFDKDRLGPILDLFEKSGPDTSIAYYHPNILYLSVKGKLALGLSPRKNYISFYVSSYESNDIFQEASQGLGVSSSGTGCYRFNKLSNINMDALAEVFKRIYASDHNDGGVLIPLQ
ncbi:MAG: DUF1801 domain-containing protein [Candidatus Cloacimonadaceae bacterium]|nr:DUF1801 domain-containing protein [Candidatus Cloacimonadaceae bacterium]